MTGHASLRALRAFTEVVARGGVAPAAQALGISPSAVSHLLRELEASLGVGLFQAGTRRSKLTEAGERLNSGIGGAFYAIDRAVSDLARPSNEVRVSTLSTFATLWLIPRLPRMQAVLPQLRVLVATDTRPVDLAAEPFDCAIRWGLGGWPNLVAVPLFREKIVAVAGPSAISGGETSIGSHEFLALPRIAARTRPDDWPRLLAAMGCGSEELSAPALVFETRALAVRAAIAGLGVAVVDSGLVQDALGSGHLIQLTPISVERPEAHFFVARPQALRDKGVRNFRDWLVGEAEAEAQ